VYTALTRVDACYRERSKRLYPNPQTLTAIWKSFERSRKVFQLTHCENKYSTFGKLIFTFSPLEQSVRGLPVKKSSIKIPFPIGSRFEMCQTTLVLDNSRL
jgi:hypothetical protein